MVLLYLRMNSMKALFMRNTVHMLISSSARRVLPFVKMRFAALSVAGSEERTHGTSRMRGHTTHVLSASAVRECA